MPVLGVNVGGVSGRGHGNDYLVTDWDTAVVDSAKAMALTVIDLLYGDAARAKEVLDRSRPEMTREAYLSLQRERAPGDRLRRRCRITRPGGEDEGHHRHSQHPQSRGGGLRGVHPLPPTARCASPGGHPPHHPAPGAGGHQHGGRLQPRDQRPANGCVSSCRPRQGRRTVFPAWPRPTTTRRQSSSCLQERPGTAPASTRPSALLAATPT